MLDKRIALESAKKVEAYLNKVLLVRPTLKGWSEEKSLPIFLRDLYAFYTVDLLRIKLLFAIQKGEVGPSTSSIGKHLIKVQEIWPGPVAYVTEEITGATRARLIEKGIPFLVPEKQMFLPMLGIDLQERFMPATERHSGISPATQVLILDAIYEKGERVYSVAKSAERFGYSAMTLSRVFDDLEKAKIGVHRTRGRTRQVIFTEPKREIWEGAAQALKSPVQKTVHIMQPYSGKALTKTGLTALAQYSNLAEPEMQSIGMDGKSWLSFRANEIYAETRSPEPYWTALEIWSYSPSRFSRGGIADPLSVYLSLKKSQDERVQQALEELMEEMQW